LRLLLRARLRDALGPREQAVEVVEAAVLGVDHHDGVDALEAGRGRGAAGEEDRKDKREPGAARHVALFVLLMAKYKNKKDRQAPVLSLRKAGAAGLFRRGRLRCRPLMALLPGVGGLLVRIALGAAPVRGALQALVAVLGEAAVGVLQRVA